MSATISRELSFQSRVHQYGIKQSAFSGLTTQDQRKETFRALIIANNKQAELGKEFELLYGEPL